MKLLRELTESVDLLEEDLNTTGGIATISGVFLQGGVLNRNGRIYPHEVMDKEVDRYIKEELETNRAVGELSHPDNPEINLERISHRIVELKKVGDNYVGKAIILDTPQGNVVKGLLKGGVKLGVSSRGLGTLKEDRKSKAKIVQNDFRLITAADIVANPSAPNAWVDAINEGVSWVRKDDGSYVKAVDNINEAYRSLDRNKREEMILEAFQNFLNNISVAKTTKSIHK